MQIVQISTDLNLLHDKGSSEPLQRQQNYAALLQQQNPNANLTVLVLSKQGYYAPRVFDGLTIIPVKTRRLFTPFVLFRTLKHLHAQQPIALVSPQSPLEEGWGALLFCKRFGVKVLGQLHFDLFAKSVHIDHTPLHSAWNKIRFWLARQTLRFYDYWRVVAPILQEGLKTCGYRGPISVIPVPIFWLDEIGKIQKPFDRLKQVIFVGRLAVEKQLDQWLDIAKIVVEHDSSVRFKIAGSGPMHSVLEQKIADLNLKEVVELVGQLKTTQDLISFYTQADCFLLTSAYEGFGRVIVEAAACETPTVSYDVAGARAILRDGENGLLVAQGDKAQAADALLRLLRSDSDRLAMGQDAKNTVAKAYAPQELAQTWVATWLSLAN